MMHGPMNVKLSYPGSFACPYIQSYVHMSGYHGRGNTYRSNGLHGAPQRSEMLPISVRTLEFL